LTTTFTIEEAVELVPWLQSTFDTVQLLIGKLDGLAREVDGKSLQLQSDGGDEAEEEMNKAEKSRREVAREVRLLIDSVEERGILIKDIQRGLFDFPSLREGNIIYLCWLAGEPELEYWHTVDSGFAGRQSL
jgi:hypothetical protein